MAQNNLFCFGLGYTGKQLANYLTEQGWEVSGTTSTVCDNASIKTYQFGENFSKEFFSQFTHILISIPPGENGDLVLKQYRETLENTKELQWVGYLSSTSVYGDHQGALVTEESKTNPLNERGLKRLSSENEWLTSELPVHIFRLPGIYGKGRSVIEQLQNGTAKRVYKEGQVFSRIHVEDICNILYTSMNKPNAYSIYNCADDEPSPQADIVEYAAKLLGITPPPLIDFAKANLSPMAASFYESNRRICNTKIKKELGVILKYPTYRDGLQNIIISSSFSI